MENKQNRMSPIIESLQRFAAIFSQTVLIFSIAGILLAQYAPQALPYSTLFDPDGKGLPYSSVLQLAGCSIIIAIFSVILYSEYVQAKVRFLFRSILLFLGILAISTIFAVIYKWYPFRNIRSWLNFAMYFTASFATMHIFVTVKLKLEWIKYNRLLKNYKARHKDNLSHSDYAE